MLEKAWAGDEVLENPVSLLSDRIQEVLGHLSLLCRSQAPRCPEFESIVQVKQFCVGLLDPCEPHPLRAWVDKMSERNRRSVMHSLFLCRKLLPAGDKRGLVDDYMSRMSTPTSLSDPGFLTYIYQEVPRLFREGWDASFGKRASSFVLGTSSCLEAKGSEGGSRSRAGARVRYMMTSILAGRRRSHIPRECRVACVKDGGKWRIVTCNSYKQAVLKPLHDTIYSHLSKKPWLLRGDAKRSSFRDFSRREGEVFVSGDYEAATDNIPHDIYLAMLDAVRSSSTHVPSEVWDAAFGEVSKDLLYQGRRVTQRRGQLMGSFLSFPFLCLLNFLAFKYAVPRHVPLRINGDDIVFRATPEEEKAWKSSVGGCGFTLSPGKTLTSDRFFTLNSTPFIGGRNGAETVPFIRPAALFNTPNTPFALKGQYESVVVGAPGSAFQRSVRVSFLVKHRRTVLSTQRSLTRGCGMRVCREVLRRSHLEDREKFYLSLQKEEPLPAPKGMWSILPDGWEQVDLPHGSAAKRNARAEQEKFYEELTDLCWVSSPTSQDGRQADWDRVREGTFRYSGPLKIKPGLLKCVSRRGKKFVLPPVCQSRERVWLRKDRIKVPLWVPACTMRFGP